MKIEPIKVSEVLLNQSKVVHELALQVKGLRPDMLEGLFCTSNSDAFAIARDVTAGVLKELKATNVESLAQAVEDILRISESLEISGLDLSTIKSLDDLELPIPELLDWIATYDKTASDWKYSLEDMRRTDFIGIFCPDCDEEIGGELDCTNCSSIDD